MSSFKSSNSLEGNQTYEFSVSAELYIPTGFRKHPISRRKTERAENVKAREDIIRKVKERSNWISITRQKWRPATCNILHEYNDYLLYIYIDDAILYQTVSIDKLSHTDIRLAHPSLFLRKNCIELCLAGETRWCTTATPQPIYLHFNNSDTCNTWLVLLRSYAKPELYGQPSFANSDGLYRMWRQVDLAIIQGRHLGNTRSFVGSPISPTSSDARPEADPVDLDVFCEIHINDVVRGRTTVKKGIGSPEWHESFLFVDLSPFEAMEVSVWKEKRLTKPVLLGAIRVSLTDFRRNEDVEGWFPVTQPCDPSCSTIVGEIKMKLRIDEEIILPHSSYLGMLSVLRSRNVLEWMEDFERQLQLRSLSVYLMYIAVAKNEFLDHIIQYADREVDGTPTSHNILFRGNTTFTRTMELAMAFYGQNFLENSIGKIVHRLCSEQIAIEVDPARSGKHTKDTERAVEELVRWCQDLWDSIYANRSNCPHELRRLFEHIRKLVENRYKKAGQGKQNRELPWQSVSAFCFLRLMVPAILRPHQFGLFPTRPSPPVQRSLTLIAKVIQNLANLNSTVQKEEFMRGVKDFLQQNVQAMVDYILAISTPALETYHPHTGSLASDCQRLQVVDSLHRRGSSMSMLSREAIPLLPHGLDVPRYLACISSALARGARMADAKPTDEGEYLHELRVVCFEVEKMGLQRVSQLTGLTGQRLGPKVRSLAMLLSQSSPTYQGQDTPRPSTAPSLPESTSLASSHSLPTNFSRTDSILHPSAFLRWGSLPYV